MNCREALQSFIVEAHQNGYATTDPDQAEDFTGKRIEYSNDEWCYVDQYVGSRAFIGFEVVFRHQEPVWGMNYYGAPIDSTTNHEQVYSFLRRALERASISSPYRGPDSFHDGRFTYRSDTEGSIDRFAGIEEIEDNGSVIYRGEYGGGDVD